MAGNREVYVPLSETSVSLNCQRLSRRTMLQCGALGLGGLLLGNRLGPAAEKAAKPKPGADAKPAAEPKAKAVIQVWLSGGPPHTDTFDPKPNAGSDYTGPLNKDIETNVKGIRLGAPLPELAKIADKYSIIRSMTHGKNGHETASYMVQTGRMPRRPAGLSGRGRRGHRLQGIRGGLAEPDPALHRAYAAAGPVLRGRVQWVSSTSRSQPAATPTPPASPWRG